MDLSRVAMVIGQENLFKIQKTRVAVIGLGGVGSYIAEALCRSGIGELLLIDADIITESNLNRQLPALVSTLGSLKTEVVRNRLLDINPHCKIEIISKFYKQNDFEEFFLGKIDFIADAIDSTVSKVDILYECVNRGIPVISAMGTGNKLDPSLLQLSDISKTSMCPLAKAVRKKLRELGIERGVSVVYSTEQPQKVIKDYVPGSMVFVPAAAGMLIASHIIRKIIEE